MREAFDFTRALPTRAGIPDSRLTEAYARKLTSMNTEMSEPSDLFWILIVRSGLTFLNFIFIDGTASIRYALSGTLAYFVRAAYCCTVCAPVAVIYGSFCPLT